MPALAAKLRRDGVALPPELRFSTHRHAWRTAHLTSELGRVTREFDQCGIQFLALKGPVLAQQLYGHPGMRQFGDLDLLVRPRDVARARLVLIKLGYEPQLRLSARQGSSYLRSGYELAFGLGADRHLVELQWGMVPRFYAMRFEVEALFHRAINIEFDGVKIRTLGREDLMLALCVHAAKHEWSQLGMLRDIMTLAQFDLDWEWILAEGGRLGILKILKFSMNAGRVLLCAELRHEVQSRMLDAAAIEFAGVVENNLRRDQEPESESFRYIRSQLAVRERWRDRTTFLWRLAFTSGIEEWKSIKLPEGLFPFYRTVRIARLLRRFSRTLRRLGRERDSWTVRAAPIPRA